MMGFGFALITMAAAASGTIAGLIHDITGSYTLAFILVVVIIVIGLVSVSLARKPEL